MNLYEYIKENKTTINTLFKCGVLSSSVINNYSIYQYMLDSYDVGNSKSMTIELAKEQFKVSSKTIYNIIAQFSETV